MQTARSNVTKRKHAPSNESPCSTPRRWHTDRPSKSLFQHCSHDRHGLPRRQVSVLADRVQTKPAKFRTTPYIPRFVRLWPRSNLVGTQTNGCCAFSVERHFTHNCSSTRRSDGRQNDICDLVCPFKNCCGDTHQYRPRGLRTSRSPHFYCTAGNSYTHFSFVFGINQRLHLHRGRLEIINMCNKLHRERVEIINNLISYTACPLSCVLCPLSFRVKVDILFCSLLPRYTLTNKHTHNATRHRTHTTRTTTHTKAHSSTRISFCSVVFMMIHDKLLMASGNESWC